MAYSSLWEIRKKGTIIMFKSKNPDLRFGRTESLSGFGVYAEQAILNPTTIVRELVQNSLDAAQKAGREKAIIRFEIESHRASDIPALNTYKKAFEQAKKSQEKREKGNLPDSAKKIVNAMEKQINEKTIETLFVMDNGCGVDKNTMVGLLGEGISAKDHGSAGSYGYGHTTVIPSSDLRYMLYGGFNGNESIASGHAVLASFEESNQLKSEHGYFILGVTGNIENPYKFPTNKQIPDLIKNKLEAIKGWGVDSGTVVIIPGFNYFNEEKDLWTSIKRAVACNFFVAVEQGKLRVELKLMDEEEIQIIDKSNLKVTLECFKTERQNKHFLSGQKANIAYETMLEGEEHSVPTKLGDVTIKLLKSGERYQFDLCRNGMHITNSPPKSRPSNFANYQPFHCLILIDKENEKISRLVRQSEPPKHNEIITKNIAGNGKKDLENVFSDIKAFLQGELTELDNEEFEIPDVLNIETHGINTLEELRPPVRTGGKRRGVTGKGRGRGSGKAGRGGTDFFRKAGNAISFQAVAVPTGNRSYEMQMKLQKTDSANELRFALDESLDITCDNANAESFVKLHKIKIDDSEPSPESLIKNEEGDVLGISLGKIESEKNSKITFDYSLPDDIDLKEDARVSLKAELVGRQADKEN